MNAEEQRQYYNSKECKKEAKIAANKILAEIDEDEM